VIAGAVAAVIIIVIFATTYKSGPQPPDVKFEGFTPDGQQIIKDGQIIHITFKVHNYEPRDIDNARVVTTHKGDSKYFVVDKPDYVISPAIGAKDGESGTQTIVIRGANLGGQPAIEDTFTFTLYVGIEPTDKREFSVRLE
jgi:hypothetical protein